MSVEDLSDYYAKEGQRLSDEAKKHYQEAAVAACHLAALQSLHSPDKALETYQQALKLDPTNQKALEGVERLEGCDVTSDQRNSE